MSDAVIVSTTVGTPEDAERIATALIEARLAACVQIVGPIRSRYRWQGAIETAEEWRCDAKTIGDLASAAMDRIATVHPYETPEVIVTPIVDGTDAYLAWLRAAVAPAEPPG